MVAIWRHIIVSFQVFGTERVHWNLDFLGEAHQWEVHWGKECLSIGGCRLNGLRGTSSPFCRHQTNPCIPRAAGTQRVNLVITFYDCINHNKLNTQKATVGEFYFHNIYISIPYILIQKYITIVNKSLDGSFHYALWLLMHESSQWQKQCWKSWSGWTFLW
jgi:hypothetical protein